MGALEREIMQRVSHIDPVTGVVTPISGPASPWPRESLVMPSELVPVRKDGVLTSRADIVKGLAKNAGRVLKKGWVPKKISEERFATCKSCVLTQEDYETHRKTLAMYNEREGFGYTLPAPNEFVLSKDSRCRICGCPMKTKTRVNFPPDKLCPLNRWKR